MDTVKINDFIEILPAAEHPLSADVVIVKAKDAAVVFDVGANEEALRLVNGIAERKIIVVSHFHADHCGNLEKVSINEGDRVFGGRYTCKKFPGMNSVEDEVEVCEEVTVFTIPSSHSKGCVGLRIGDYALLGDAAYAGKGLYDVSLLARTIRTIEHLPSTKLMTSHNPVFFREKPDILHELKQIYALKKQGEAYVKVI